MKLIKSWRVMGITSTIIAQIEALGFAVSVHRMGDYCEMHAVLLADPDQQHIARVDGDGEDDTIAPPASWRRWWGLSWRMGDEGRRAPGYRANPLGKARGTSRYCGRCKLWQNN